MDRSSVFTASVTALSILAVWWMGIRYLDGVLALRLPYHQYELVGLLYPEVYYPVLPGWVLAHLQPSSIGVWIVTLGWLVALSTGLGWLAAKYASERGTSTPVAAGALVITLFTVVTVLETAAWLVT